MKSFIIESIRRLAQMIAGLEVFGFPGLNAIRRLLYRAVFDIGPCPIIGRSVRLYRTQLLDGLFQLPRP